MKVWRRSLFTLVRSYLADQSHLQFHISQPFFWNRKKIGEIPRKSKIWGDFLHLEFGTDLWKVSTWLYRKKISLLVAIRICRSSWKTRFYFLNCPKLKKEIDYNDCWSCKYRSGWVPAPIRNAGGILCTYWFGREKKERGRDPPNSREIHQIVGILESKGLFSRFFIEFCGFLKIKRDVP